MWPAGAPTTVNSLVWRRIRSAIDEFRRDTVGINCTGTSVTQGGNQQQAQAPVDPRRDADPLFDADTLAAARGLRERFVGTLFGLAVGDAVAAATQFRRPGSFSPVGDMLGGGPFDLPRGAETVASGVIAHLIPRASQPRAPAQ